MKVVRLLVAVLVLGAKAPWIITAHLLALARVTGRGARLVRRAACTSPTELTCPAGHRNAVLGRWKCGCGFELIGHAFAPCPSCGEEAGWFPCRTCGLGVQDPLQH